MKQRHGASRLGGLLKRRLLPAILSLSMAVSLALPGGLFAAAAGGFETNLTNLHGLSGTWTAEDDGFHGASAGGDNFAIADDVVGADDLFIYEADITSDITNPDFNASLIYGLKNPSTPSERFYNFGVMPGSNQYIRFDQTNGAPLSGVQTGAIEEKDTYHVKIVRNSQTEFEFFIDDTLVYKTTHDNFEGGYVGMMTNDKGVWQNVKLTITGSTQGFVSNLTGWTAQSGTWTETPQGYASDCAGNCFLLSDKALSGDALFTYEVDMTPESNNNGLAFGVKDPQNPTARWYCFSVEGDNILIFNQTDGNPGDSLRIIPLTEEEKGMDTYHLKVVRKDASTFEYYLGERLVQTETYAAYEGGTFGLLSTGKAVFQNVSLTEEGTSIAGFTSNLSGWHGVSGTWNFTQDGYEGNCAGNQFAMSGKEIGDDVLFVYEADMTPKANASGIVFGVQNPDDPITRWYCFNVERTADGGSNTMLFDQTNGIPNVLRAEPLTEEEKAKDTYHMKVVREGETTFKFYLDDREVFVQDFAGFEGGYFGVMSTGNGIFNNVNFTETGKVAGEGFVTNLSGWRGVSGTWSETEDGFKGSGAGNVFAMSTKAVNSHDPFTFEADMELPLEETAGGITFGVKDPQNPSGKWFCINVDRGGPLSRIFAQTNGNPDFIQDFPLTDDEKVQTTFHLKVVREVEDGPVKFYLGDRLLLEKELTTFEGGYFGVMSCNSTVTFNHVYYTINGSDAAFSSNLTGWRGVNGTWTTEAGGFQGVSTGGNTWAIAEDFEIDGNTSFIFEGDMELKAGNHAGGLIFGVKDPDNPAGYPSQWYCIMAAKGDGNFMAFAHKDNSPQFIETAGLSDGDKATEIYHLRVEYLESKTANFYINGTLYKSISLPNFEGGYFGVMVSGPTTATFDNVNYYRATTPKLDGMELIGAEMDKPFDPAEHSYWAEVDHSVSSVKVKTDFDDTLYSVTVGEQQAAPGEEVSVNLADGLNTVRVVVRDPGSDLSDTYTINVTRQPDPDTLYHETARPQLHFTPYMYQMNDPNGLLYDDATGLYHLFFQCNRPFDTGVEGLSGTTSWGHAISKDMINWRELPLAITPDELGWAYSGSGVIDRYNTSGLFEEDPSDPDYTPPGSRIVLFYANVAGDTTHGYAKESMAYSTDGGQTFIKYEGNPVVKNPGNMYGAGLRDPKVFWYEDETMENGGIWVMVTVGELHIFTSHNLIDWKHCGRPEINGQVFDSECPDLYPLPVDGDPNNVKWVYTGGGIFYVIGHMEKTGEDTVMFVPETDKLYALNGIADQGPGNPAPETYATQTFHNEKLGRTISISWLRDPSGLWKDKNWNSAQSLPMEHSLHTVDGQVKLFSYPAEEVNSMRDEKILDLKDIQVDENSENVLKDIQATLCDMDATITLGTATQVGFKLRTGEAGGGQELVITYNREDGKLYVDKTKTGGGSYLGVYEPDLTLMEGDQINLRMILDQICFDVYGNYGEAAVAGLIYTEFENAGMEFFANGTATIDSLEIYSMKQMDRTTDFPDPVVPTELSDLELSNGTLAPAFDKDTLSYTATVANPVSSVKVMPTYTGDTAVTVNGKDVASGSYSEDIALDVGPNAITVAAGDKTYTITVTREEEEQPPVGEKPLLDGLELSEGALIPAFDKGTFSYTAAVGNEVEGVQVKAFFADGITAMLGEEALESGVYSEEIPLRVGENEIIVTLSLEGEESEYVIVVTREEEAVTEPEPTPGTDKPSIPGSDEDQVGGGDWDWPSGSGNDSTNGSGSGEKENPASGDSSMVAGALAVLALSAGAVVVLSRKKK